MGADLVVQICRRSSGAMRVVFPISATQAEVCRVQADVCRGGKRAHAAQRLSNLVPCTITMPAEQRHVLRTTILCNGSINCL